MALWGLQVAIKFSYTWGYVELSLLLSICTWPHQFSSCQLFFPVSQVPQTKEVLCFLFSKTTVFQFLTIWLCGNLCFCSGSLSLQFVQYSCCCEMGWYIPDSFLQSWVGRRKPLDVTHKMQRFIAHSSLYKQE